MQQKFILWSVKADSGAGLLQEAAHCDLIFFFFFSSNNTPEGIRTREGRSVHPQGGVPFGATSLSLHCFGRGQTFSVLRNLKKVGKRGEKDCSAHLTAWRSDLS